MSASYEEITNKEKWLSYLYYNVGHQNTDFRICHTRYVEGEKPRFIKWISYRDADEQQKKKADQREQLNNEIIFDKDEGDYQSLIDQLRKDGIYFYAYKTKSNRAQHIHTYWKGLGELSEQDRKTFREFLLKKYECDLMLSTDHHMIALENCEHWKTKEIKEIYDKNEGINDKGAFSEEFQKYQESIWCSNKLNRSGFILDSSEVYQTKNFLLDSLNGDTVYMGLLLPKWKEQYIKGVFIKNIQVLCPALITSNNEIIPLDSGFEEKYHTKLENIPNALPLRWSLDSINNFIKLKKVNDMSIKDIHNTISDQYRQYISMPDIWSDIHALWDIATYFYTQFKIFPIFEIRGLSGTAKNKAMTISCSISFNTSNIMVDPSEATLFRELGKTKYIDEAENLFNVRNGKVEHDQRVEVINSSYRYDGTVPRQEKVNNKFITVYYHTYSPTMLSSINGLYGSTESRAIIRISTKPSKADEYKGNKEPEPTNDIWQKIRDELHIYTLKNCLLIKNLYDTHNNTTGLKNRDYWLWKPLLIIAELISPELYDRVLLQAIRQQDVKQQDYISEDSTDFKILFHTYELLSSSEKVYVKGIHAKLPQDTYTPKEKTISNKLDKLGFRDYRAKDRNGSFFNIPKQLFESIIMPMCPAIFSSQSSQSSQKESITDDNQSNNYVMNNDECDESVSTAVTDVTKLTNVTNIRDKNENIPISEEFIDDNPTVTPKTVLDVITDKNPCEYNYIKDALKCDSEARKTVLNNVLNHLCERGDIFENPSGVYQRY